ncbi:MAG: nicotinate-nucleotide--dimethylbenzimidazole phosphoribosyltransferase, partial [Paracoccaceae bacterium]
MTLPFATLSEFAAILNTPSGADLNAFELASARNAQLTKPAGALGRLEELALWYAGWRGEERPRIERPQVLIFAGNHGVTAQGVSLFPPEVTA